MLDAVSTLTWIHGRPQASLKSLSVNLTKGNVSQCTLLPQNKPMLLLLHANKQLLCLLPDPFDAKEPHVSAVTDTTLPRQSALYLLPQFKPIVFLSDCLSVTVSLDETGACQTEAGCQLWINQINQTNS